MDSPKLVHKFPAHIEIAKLLLNDNEQPLAGAVLFPEPANRALLIGIIDTATSEQRALVFDDHHSPIVALVSSCRMEIKGA
ncbi:hypothetical protein [Bosea sp. (in: a-proteobacteria)]|jgi:hypothetical protein|uniref:hypothetical protein n=1 Tax=Bosea sp. (in: a-proteobacteria) TaxID=1871050 RepID=UPI003F6E80C8